MPENGLLRKNYLAGLLAFVLLGIFILVNYYRAFRALHEPTDPLVRSQVEILPATFEGKGKTLAFHDFESGNAGDTASHLAFPGRSGHQSLKMTSKVPFSPGLWSRFKDLHAGDSAWIRATGYVWFSCPAAEAECSLVATCNRSGTNYKYMPVPVEKEAVEPGRWNKISIDYRIPSTIDPEDVVQVYFWYRGKGEMLVDDIGIEIFTPGGKLKP